jgi:hypothetical protein
MSISEIKGNIQFGQQLVKYYKNKDNHKRYLKLIKEGTYQKNSFRVDFNEKRKRREESFKTQKSLIIQKSMKKSYKSVKVHEVLEKAKKKINNISKEKFENDPLKCYAKAKEIGEHIENFFTDKIPNKEASMESLCEINTIIGVELGAFKILQAKDSVFSDFRTIYERIQNIIMEVTKKLAEEINDNYLTVPTKSKVSDNKSGKSGNSSHASSEETTPTSTNKSPSQQSNSNSSQIIDLL